jgi:hypothetical protein
MSFTPPYGTMDTISENNFPEGIVTIYQAYVVPVLIDKSAYVTPVKPESFACVTVPSAGVFVDQVVL